MIELIFYGIILGPFIVVGIILLVQFINTEARGVSLRDSLEKYVTSKQSCIDIKSVPYTDRLNGVDGRGMLTLVRKNNSVLLSTSLHGGFVHREYTPAKILSCEIIEDGIASASSSSQLGGAAVGGLLFGGAGAIVGAMASSNPQNKVGKIELKINVSDLDYPCWIVTIQDSPQVPTDSSKYKTSIQVARQWHGRVIALVAGAVDSESAESRRKIQSTSL